MRYWFANNPFALLLIPLVAGIVVCSYVHWPCEIDEVVPLPMDSAFYSVVVQTLPQPRAKTYRYAVAVQTAAPHPRSLLYIRHDSSLLMPSMGDTLLVYTAWHVPDSLGTFDYATYLRRQGISAIGYVDRWSWQVIGENHTPWWRGAQGWQQMLKTRYHVLGIDNRELGTICALTLGYREDLEPELRRQFSAAGAMHVLAVSGLHTHILMTVLVALITLFGLCKPLYEQHIRRWIMGSIVIACLIAYAWLTGATPSVVRAVIMSCMMLLAFMCQRTNQMLNALFAAAFFILLFCPTDLFSVSFQLSFAAVLSIALFMPGWKRILPQNYFFGLIGMSIAAMIGTMPLTLYYYGQISNYFLLTNLIVLPLAWLMMVGGLFTLTLGWITPLGKILAWILNAITWLLNESVGWIEHLPWATTQIELPFWGLGGLMGVNSVMLILWDRMTTPEKKWR